MNKLLVVALAIISMASSALAQDAKKTLKSASKDLAQYYQDPITNAGKLDLALVSVNKAFEDEAVKSDPESWLIKGDIYNSIGNSESNMLIINKDYQLKTPDAGLKAAEAYKKSLEMAVKKNHTKDAIKGLQDSEGNLSNAGIAAFTAKEYLKAFENFNTYLQVYNILKTNKAKSRLDEDTLRQDIQYYNVLSGYYGKADEAVLLPLLMDLYKSDTDKSLVYEAIFNLNVKKDEAGSLAILEAGRKKFPDETGLLFAEINFYLTKGKLDVLVDKLKAAIAKEPNNVSVYTTLGNVYDQLVTKERTAGNGAKAQEYFDAAFDYYNQAIKIDPKNFDATYSLGALYYNKAASLTADLNKLSNDYSKDGTKKYNTLKAEMEGIFEQALPYFIKAEGLDPKDANTMIALKEIYARKGQLEKSTEYKAKLEALGK
jgi:tetratricopeptide (TPR) repeat protein